MTPTAVIVLGMLIWVLVAIPLALFLARMTQLNRPQAPAAEPPREPSVDKPVLAPAFEAKLLLNPPVEVMARFPAEPLRFVGRAEVMAAARTALTPISGRAAVVFHGMAGVGKTTCAVELAYGRQSSFVTVAFWSAPTDPDQFGEALRLLAVAWEAQLADYGLAMVEEIAPVQRLQNFLPTLTAVLTEARLLLVLDKLDTLLTPDGKWRDPGWAPLISALTNHQGFSRVILTSRIVPAGLNPDTVLIKPVHALSQKESLWLIRRLPRLRTVLHTEALGRRVLTLAQGHPQLLELADAAAANPSRLAYQLAEIEQAVDQTAPLAAFLTEGGTRLDAEQMLQTVTAWILAVATTLPTAARLLLQALCRIEESDRSTAVLGANWAALWRRWDQSSEPPPLGPAVGALVTAALIATDPSSDPTEPVRYRIHPGVVEAIHAVTPQPVSAAVDAQLAAWWSAVVGGWGIEQPHTDTGHLRVQASLAAARYLLRQHDYNAASCLLEGVLIEDSYSLLTSLAVIPLLRRIAEATDALTHRTVLAAALRKVDLGEAEALLRRVYDQATIEGEHGLASTTAGEFVTLLRDQGRLGEALTLADQKIEHTHRAGFGSWTQLSDQGRRLQILHLLGDHVQVLLEMPALRARMAGLRDQRADNDRVNPYNAREGILDVGRLSAMALQRWDDALELNDEIASTQRRRGTSPHHLARTRFNDYLPLLQLGRLADADHLLRHCQASSDAIGDSTQLAMIYSSRAELEDKRDHPVDAVELQRTSLRLCYVHPDPRKISTAHQHLATYLSRTFGRSAEQRAHRLTATLLHHLTGDTRELTKTLRALASELRSDTAAPDAPAPPATLLEITRLVDADDGVRFGDLMVALCPNPATAEHALAHLLATAAISADQDPTATREHQTPENESDN